MTREFKFRVFQKNEKKMYEVFSFCTGFVKVIVGIGTASKVPNNLFEPIMQCTGLKDKNGINIYEGDIIKNERQWGVIVWNAPFFEVTVSETQSCMYSRDWFDSVEVIGNIYENPELLEQ